MRKKPSPHPTQKTLIKNEIPIPNISPILQKNFSEGFQRANGKPFGRARRHEIL